MVTRCAHMKVLHTVQVSKYFHERSVSNFLDAICSLKASCHRVVRIVFLFPLAEFKSHDVSFCIKN